MEVAPDSAFEWPITLDTSGLEGVVAVQIDDGTDNLVFGPSVDDIVEIGFTGVYVASLTSPSERGTYVLMASPDGTFTPGDVITEELVVTGFTGDFETPTGDAYVTVEELARVLKIRTPTAAQIIAMQRVLIAAAGEINSEIDFPDGAEPLTGWQLSLAAEVNIERAVEHWQQEESPFGVIGLGTDAGGLIISRDTWDRHAQKLVPLKQQWGLA